MDEWLNLSFRLSKGGPLMCMRRGWGGFGSWRQTLETLQTSHQPASDLSWVSVHVGEGHHHQGLSVWVGSASGQQLFLMCVLLRLYGLMSVSLQVFTAFKAFIYSSKLRNNDSAFFHVLLDSSSVSGARHKDHKFVSLLLPAHRQLILHKHLFDIESLMYLC